LLWLWLWLWQVVDVVVVAAAAEQRQAYYRSKAWVMTVSGRQETGVRGI